MSVFVAHWILWALVTAEVSVLAASVPRPGLLYAYQLAEATNQTIQVEGFQPSPAIQRQFEASSQQLSTSKPPSDGLLTDNFSYYHIPAADDLVLDIRHDDDTRLNLPGRQRLLALALLYFTGRIEAAGRDRPLNNNCFVADQMGVTLEVMDDSRFLLTYGMAFDALRALTQFFQARPTRNGETVALIRIPSMSPVREEDPVGYILLGRDEGLTARRRCIGGSREAR